MKLLVPSKLKKASLSQCIIQAARPRSVIAPIPFGVGISVDKTTGCRQLIKQLATLGFSITPDEVDQFKQSAIVQTDNEENNAEPRIEVFANACKQWIADNVDHNVATLSGEGTFHGMGIICIGNDSVGGTFGNISRLKERQPASTFSSNRGVEIIPYHQIGKIGKDLKIDPISTITSFKAESRMSNYDLLWHSRWFLSSEKQPRSNWSGFMQCATILAPQKGSHSSIKFLPIIDLSPSNESCIYSTLLFIIEQANKMNVGTPCVTFDQPLWLKATDIIHTEGLSIICRLGGFHTLMSFLGSIGTLMAGTGLKDVFSEIYAENSVTHMLSGKAIARAIRAHILTASALW